MNIVGIIGDPIRHSLSPAMQNAAFRAMDLSFLYLPFRVAPEELGGFLLKARRWRLAGFNVTVPHKETILEKLDRVSPEAAAIGAVNTVALKGKKLCGFNTDASGYIHSLIRDAKFHPRGKTVMILGAGGAARAVLYAVGQAGARRILLCNRTPSRAGRVARAFRKKFKTVSIESIPLKTGALRNLFPLVDLLINATSVGLNRTRFKGLPLSFLPRKVVVSDLVYSPLMTPLLRDAKRVGLKIHPGFGMLLRQGAESFRIWTGRKADLPVMRKTLLDALKFANSPS